MSEPVQRRTRVNGVELAWFERGVPRPDEPSLVFVHATGFHGRVWDRIIEAFADHHSIALELRGHGRSEKTAMASWLTAGEDVAAFASELELSNAIGVGHALGAHALVDAAPRTDAFARLVLLDPTIGAPDSDADLLQTGQLQSTTAGLRVFDSSTDMADHLLKLGTFDLFNPRVLADYCIWGLEQTGPGRFELACPPALEAALHARARTYAGIHESVHATTLPVLILRARHPAANSDPGTVVPSPTWPGLVAAFANAREIHYPQTSHYIPMEMPDEVIRVIAIELEAWRAVPDRPLARQTRP
jgi:pimeloyl-ACP methyl ester carboxylesterase